MSESLNDEYFISMIGLDNIDCVTLKSLTRPMGLKAQPCELSFISGHGWMVSIEKGLSFAIHFLLILNYLSCRNGHTLLRDHILDAVRKRITNESE
jgi:hypothetical protein